MNPDVLAGPILPLHSDPPLIPMACPVQDLAGGHSLDMTTVVRKRSLVLQVPSPVVVQEVPLDRRTRFQAIQAAWKPQGHQLGCLIASQHPVDVPTAIGQFVSKLDGRGICHVKAMPRGGTGCPERTAIV